MISFNKSKIIATIIISLVCNSLTFVYAGEWRHDNLGYAYFYDDGTVATGWRWIDTDNDSVAECYRFKPNGYMEINATTSDGKEVNEFGQWVVNGVVQRIYTSSGRPLSNNLLGLIDKPLEEEDEYEEYYEDVLVISTSSSATASVATMSRVKKRRKITPSNLSKRIDATGKDVYNEYREGSEEDAKNSKSKSKNKKDSTVPKGDPRSIFTPSETGYILSGRANFNKPKPKSDGEVKKVIDTLVEDEPKYLSEEDLVLIGKDMTDLVSGSNKFTKSVQNVKVYGGDVWEEAMLLSGNGSSVKFNMEKYNWFRMEVAHQTHGESTKDTYVYIELYVGSDQVAVYDSFNDDKPEVIEEWIDDSDKTITLKVTVDGDAKGRKIYIRNARARHFKDPE